jgi:hypothetical protein
MAPKEKLSSMKAFSSARVALWVPAFAGMSGYIVIGTPQIAGSREKEPNAIATPHRGKSNR